MITSLSLGYFHDPPNSQRLSQGSKEGAAGDAPGTGFAEVPLAVAINISEDSHKEAAESPT